TRMPCRWPTPRCPSSSIPTPVKPSSRARMFSGRRPASAGGWLAPTCLSPASAMSVRTPRATPGCPSNSGPCLLRPRSEPGLIRPAGASRVCLLIGGLLVDPLHRRGKAVVLCVLQESEAPVLRGHGNFLLRFRATHPGADRELPGGGVPAGRHANAKHAVGTDGFFHILASDDLMVQDEVS